MTRKARTLQYKWTQRRQDWLEQLARSGCGHRSTLVGYECMQLGLTEWEINPLTGATFGEKLTLLGKYTLAEWRTGFRGVPRGVPEGWQP